MVFALARIENGDDSHHGFPKYFRCSAKLANTAFEQQDLSLEMAETKHEQANGRAPGGVHRRDAAANQIIEKSVP